MNTAEEWRRLARKSAEAEAVDLELPSGMVVRARRPSPEWFVHRGKLPFALVAIAAGQIPKTDLDRAEIVTTMEFMHDVLVHCVVEPEISIEPRPDTIHPRDIPQDDLFFIQRWALRGVETDSLATFRGEPGDARIGGDGKDPQLSAEPAPGDERPVSGAGARSGGGRDYRSGGRGGVTQ